MHADLKYSRSSPGLKKENFSPTNLGKSCKIFTPGVTCYTRRSCQVCAIWGGGGALPSPIKGKFPPFHKISRSAPFDTFVPHLPCCRKCQSPLIIFQPCWKSLSDLLNILLVKYVRADVDMVQVVVTLLFIIHV